jgi:release factor glutamine methyltransferase
MSYPSEMNLIAWQQWVSKSLEAFSDTPVLDAQVLLAQVLKKKRAWVLAYPEVSLSAAQEQNLREAVKRLQVGEPLPYVLERWEFFGRDFILTPAVLIPRPETELLVERALAWLVRRSGALRIVDVGVGSGCISVTLAAEIPGLELLAVDISWEALQVARRNAERHGVSRRVQFLQADLLTPLSGPFDLVCANLPYIPSSLLETLRVARAEPGLALDGGGDGLGLLRRLLADLSEKMNPGGLALLEIEASQGEAVRLLAAGSLPGCHVEVLPDLAGHDRLVACTLPVELI